MGTYRQPSQIIDKRFNTLNQGLQNASQTMVNGLKQIRAQEIARDLREQNSEPEASAQDDSELSSGEEEVVNSEEA